MDVFDRPNKETTMWPWHTYMILLGLLFASAGIIVCDKEAEAPIWYTVAKVVVIQVGGVVLYHLAYWPFA